MSGDVKAFQMQIKALVNALKENKTLSNNKKRVMYSKVELFRSYVKRGSLESSVAEDLLKQLDEISSSLNLTFLPSYAHWYEVVDEWVRLLVVWEILVTSALVLSIPMIILRLVDFVFVDIGLGSPYGSVSAFLKVTICSAILYCSGVVMKVEGVEHFQDDYGCSLACFSHSSTIDAFILGATIPVATCSLAKKELFLIPFFSWLLFAFGALPVDRKNRKAAVASLDMAASTGQCVTIAPEGTRSTTGQLLAFKSGPFHMWEQLQVPIVPVVVMGAYEMQPPGNKHSN
jgi:1-acyl-sn-glycerol-3-phosphate acyltransferase